MGCLIFQEITINVFFILWKHIILNDVHQIRRSADSMNGHFKSFDKKKGLALWEGIIKKKMLVTLNRLRSKSLRERNQKITQPYTQFYWKLKCIRCTNNFITNFIKYSIFFDLQCIQILDRCFLLTRGLWMPFNI